eukprot:gene3335-3659_t
MSGKKVIRIEVILSNDLAQHDNQNDTVFDLVAFAETTLEEIHQIVISTEHLENKAEIIKYYNLLVESEERRPLDLTKNLGALEIPDGGRIVADIGRKRRRPNAQVLAYEQNSSGELLHLTCLTKMFGGERSPLKEVRVLVRKQQNCQFLMEDIAELWNRTDLKFRCGRTVLVESKTFEELGIESEAKIMVTGGRG